MGGIMTYELERQKWITEDHYKFVIEKKVGEPGLNIELSGYCSAEGFYSSVLASIRGQLIGCYELTKKQATDLIAEAVINSVINSVTKTETTKDGSEN